MSREHPTRPYACVAAVILRGDQVLLVRRGQSPRKGIWTFPGGAIELGETAREACAREVLEETGLIVDVGPVVEAVDMMKAEGDRWLYHYTILDFLARPQDLSATPVAGSDAAEARWVNVPEIGQHELAPVALHVLERAIWLRSTQWPEMTRNIRGSA